MNLMNGAFEQLVFDQESYINISISNNEETFPLHWHPACEIIMPIEGTCTVTVNNHLFMLKTFDILFIAIGELHEMPAPTSGKRLIIQFDFSLISSLKDFSASISRLRSVRLIENSQPSDLYSRICQLMLDIKKEHESNHNFKDAYIYSNLLRIYTFIARMNFDMLHHFPDITPNKQHEYLMKFTQATNYIHQHYSEDLTLEKIASSANFSKYHFSRLFNQFTGKTLTNYINEHRISVAELLLLNSSTTITEVALESGFSSLSTFNRIFKSIKCCTPSEFKKLYNSH